MGPKCRRVTPNYEFLEKQLKAINNKCSSINKDTNNLLLTCCKLVEQLVNTWWTKKVKSESLQVLWEIFYKHINARFTDSDAVLKKPRDTIELLDHITTSSSNSSYEYFIYLLSHHLSVHPNQWPRIRGRIYSKLSANKINEASDIELYHIILLFLGLGSAGNLLELSNKLQSLLQNLSLGT